MNSPRRIVKIKMTPRMAADSPDFLRNVENIFQDADIEINLKPEKVEVALAQAAVESTREALDLQDHAIRENLAKVESEEESKSKTKDFLRLLAKEGFKVTVKALLEELADYAKDRLFS
jgi:hypothetical protein